jgi:hypothetical protein
LTESVTVFMEIPTSVMISICQNAMVSLGAITSHRFDTKSYGSKGGRRLTLPHRTHAVERLKAHTTNPQRTCRGAHAHAHAQVRG